MENSYTYSPRDVEAAKRIRQEYSNEKSDMDELKELTRTVERNAQVPSIVVGIICALVLGIGMCLSMITSFFVQGIIIGCVGIAGCALVPLLYKRLKDQNKAKVAARVLELSQKIIRD